jgi:hypothetical protein
MATGFYDVGPLRQVAINLFYGWGYNFYREENHLRADDQLIRSKAAWLLGLALTSVQRAEGSYRRDFLSAPTRANPLPDPVALANAKALERLGRDIDGLIGRIHAAPVPESDRMTQRHRQEAATLAGLIACDEQLIGQGELLRTTLESRSGAWMVENLPLIEDGLAAIAASLRQRQGILA